jgi:hypothetical protein
MRRSLFLSPSFVCIFITQVRQLEASLRAQSKVPATPGGALPPSNSPGNTIPSVRGSPPGTFNGGGGAGDASRFPSSTGSGGRGGILPNGMPNPNGPGFQQQQQVSSKPSGTEWLHNDDFRGGRSNSLSSSGGGLAKSNDGEASMVRKYLR